MTTRGPLGSPASFLAFCDEPAKASFQLVNLLFGWFRELMHDGSSDPRGRRSPGGLDPIANPT